MGETAKIYDLTAIRRALAARSAEARAREAAQAIKTPAVSGGAWYHEAALRDEDRTRHS